MKQENAIITVECRLILAENIDAYLDLTKSSLQDLATKMNTSRQRIHNVKQGKVNPTLEFLDSLAKAMKCEVKDLFTKKYFFV